MRTLEKTLLALSCATGLTVTACVKEEKLPAPTDPVTLGPDGKPAADGAAGQANTGAGGSESTGSKSPIARSTRSSLQWKRHAAFEADLSQALELPPEELCNEFGADSCIRTVHLSPLGGHNPFTTGLLESSAEPLVTTSTVVERVVLSACIARREKDRALGQNGVVFGGLDLDGVAPAPDAAATRGLIAGLYRRFLARDVEPSELETLAQLVRDEAGAPVSASDFAASACLAVGTSSEFLFF